MTHPSTERRFRHVLESTPPCRRCASRRVTCVGQVEDVGFFRCKDCDDVFTIQLAARPAEVAHDAHVET
jgi:transcription elongation factor Elf1